MRERLFSLRVMLWLLVIVTPTGAAFVSGSVQDDLGQTITDVRLEFGNDAGGWFLADLRDGKFEVQLGPGTWRVERWSYWDGREVDYFDKQYLISVGDSAVITNLVFPRLRSRIEGSLRTISGEPLQAHIVMQGTVDGESLRAYGYPDTNGNFGVRLPNGTWSVKPEPGMVDQAGYVPAPAQTITLVNETNTTAFVVAPITNLVRGRIVDDAGAPVPNLRMYWSSNRGFWRNVTTDANGNYSFAAQADSWSFYFTDLRERRLAMSLMMRTWIAVAEAADLTTCNVRLFRLPYDIHVRFVDENGNLYTSAPPSMIAQARVDGEAIQLSAQVVNGETDIAACPGSWTLMPNPPIANQTVNITTEPATVTFVVHPADAQSRFFGKVVDEQGVGIGNFQVQATWNGPIDTTDTDGNFEFLLPPDSLYARWIDTNYVMASTFVRPAPDQPAERIITARKATKTILVKMNFAEGAQPTSMSAWASTRIGGNSYSVSDLNGPNSVIRLRVFPGPWKVEASVPGFVAALPRVIEVGSEDVEVTFDFQAASQVSSGTVRGRVIMPSGSPLKYASVQAQGGQWDFVQTDEEGRFSVKVAGKCTVAIFNGRFGINVPAEVKAGAEMDLGTIQFPELKVKATVTFVDETGAPIKFSGYYGNEIRLTCDSGTAKFEVIDEGTENSRTALLTPGMWRIEGDTRDEGFALATPIMLEVGQSDLRTNIVLRRLGNRRTAPTLNIFKGSNGLTMRGGATTKYVDIETSSDLKTWRYFATQPMTNAIVDLTALGSGGPHVYFRAANADLPAAEE